MQEDIARILIDESQLAFRVKEMAREIVDSYESIDGHLTIVTILHGALIFVADLIRQMPVKMDLGMMTISSYRGTQSGEASIIGQLTVDISGRDVLIIDDILDTGKTIRLVREELSVLGLRSLKVATLLRKPSKAPSDVPVDFIGFDIEDSFVVGYGMDYNDHYRNLPYIAILNDPVTQAG